MKEVDGAVQEAIERTREEESSRCWMHEKTAREEGYQAGKEETLREAIRALPEESYATSTTVEYNNGRTAMIKTIKATLTAQLKGEKE